MKIRCTKDLYNGGRCFTKGKTYDTTKDHYTKASLIDIVVTNDMNQKHIIGNWWRHFTLAER